MRNGGDSSTARRQRRSAGVVNVSGAARDHATQHRLLVPDRLHKSHGPLAVLAHDLEFYGCTRRCFDQNASAVETASEGARVDAGLDAHFNRFAWPDHERWIHPDLRTICGSPTRRDPTGSRRRLEAAAPGVVSSRAGEFKAEHRPITRDIIESEGKCAASTGRAKRLRG